MFHTFKLHTNPEITVSVNAAVVRRLQTYQGNDGATVVIFDEQDKIVVAGTLEQVAMRLNHHN